MHLLGGALTRDPRLDRVKQVDLRSLQFPIRKLLTSDQYRMPRSYTWFLDVTLDQGADGACVAFAWTHELASRPGVVTGVSYRYARELYWDIQRNDDWPGGSYPGVAQQDFYEGTSVIAGAKTVKERGLIEEYRWALSLEDLVTAIGYRGPAVIGVDWTEGMLDIDEWGFIHPTGWVVGGHAVCIVGVRVFKDSVGRLDPLRSYFIIQNSWGPSWGIRGRCMMTIAEMAMLWPGGEFCIPIGRRSAAVG